MADALVFMNSTITVQCMRHAHAHAVVATSFVPHDQLLIYILYI